MLWENDVKSSYVKCRALTRHCTSHISVAFMCLTSQNEAKSFMLREQECFPGYCFCHEKSNHKLNGLQQSWSYPTRCLRKWNKRSRNRSWSEDNTGMFRKLILQMWIYLVSFYVMKEPSKLTGYFIWLVKCKVSIFKKRWANSCKKRMPPVLMQLISPN